MRQMHVGCEDGLEMLPGVTEIFQQSKTEKRARSVQQQQCKVQDFSQSANGTTSFR